VIHITSCSLVKTYDLLLNTSFVSPRRRCTGYVEQFDTQSPQLTIRETVQFSANMRLDESVPVETKEQFVNQILEMLELDKEADLLVGSDNTGGLSFEQKKRLSIAVELAANPSIIFLE
jgi:ABC-type multidrug transport system ATPase subunit